MNPLIHFRSRVSGRLDRISQIACARPHAGQFATFGTGTLIHSSVAIHGGHQGIAGADAVVIRDVAPYTNLVAAHARVIRTFKP